MDGHVEKVVRTALWSKPVYIRIGYGAREIIEDPERAFTYLAFRWPGERGVKYDAAKVACAASAKRPEFSEDAREVFIGAAIEARILD